MPLPTSKVAVLFLPDEAGYIDVCESGHQVLTVESIHNAAVAGDGVSKVLKESKDQGVITSELMYLLSLGSTGVTCVRGYQCVI